MGTLRHYLIIILPILITICKSPQLPVIKTNTVQPKLLPVCDVVTKEPLICVNVYSSKEDTCYQSDFYGQVALNCIEENSFQFEYTGYRILQLTSSQISELDTIFLKERINTDPLSHGWNIIEKEERAWENCKCCKKY